ncbi:unnamed protein product [Ixodes pacificus]
MSLNDKKKRKRYMKPGPDYAIPKQTKSNRAARVRERISLSEPPPGTSSSYLSDHSAGDLDHPDVRNGLASGDGDPGSRRCYRLDASNEVEMSLRATSEDEATSDQSYRSDGTSKKEAASDDASQDGLSGSETASSCGYDDKANQEGLSGSETASSCGYDSEREFNSAASDDDVQSDFKSFEEMCSGPTIPGQDTTRGQVLLLILAYVVYAGLS